MKIYTVGVASTDWTHRPFFVFLEGTWAFQPSSPLTCLWQSEQPPWRQGSVPKQPAPLGPELTWRWLGGGSMEGYEGVPLPLRNWLDLGRLYRKAVCAETAELWKEKSNEAMRLVWGWPLQETFSYLWEQWGRGRKKLFRKVWEIGLADMSFLSKNISVFILALFFFLMVKSSFWFSRQKSTRVYVGFCQ